MMNPCLSLQHHNKESCSLSDCKIHASTREEIQIDNLIINQNKPWNNTELLTWDSLHEKYVNVNGAHILAQNSWYPIEVT